MAALSPTRAADQRPVIIIDNREQEPLEFTHFKSARGTLYSGDYSIGSLEHSFAVERKDLGDIANCCLASLSCSRARKGTSEVLLLTSS